MSPPKRKKRPAKRRKAAPKAQGTRKAPKAAKRGSLPDLSVSLGEKLRDSELPRCSIVILNLNGRHHLKPCFDTLRALDYPEDRFEVVLVENGSTDGSVEEMRRDHAWVRLIENERNVGFAAGCNQGAEASPEAEVLVFINNDMRVDPGFLRELVSPLVRGECQATTSKMYSWDGKLLNSAGGGMNFHGIGIQRGLNELPAPEFDKPRKTLFACGGAMAMKRELFFEVGGFDAEFFAYYEDVDLGWRTWVQGHEVWYIPDSVCYHHHSSTSKRLPLEMIRLLQVRNPQLACFKNYDDAHLQKILPAMLALAMRRMLLVSGVEDQSAFRIEEADMLGGGGPVRRMLEKARGVVQDTIHIKRVAVADLIGINDLLGRFDHWSAKRAVVQSARKRADSEIFSLFLAPEWCIEREPGYLELHAGLSSMLGLDRLFEGLSEPGAQPPH